MKIGDIAVCYETKKTFVIKQDGYSFNYATDSDGRIYSDEGVDILQKRELLDRSKAFVAYVSSDGKFITGWKGNVLMSIVWKKSGAVGFCRDGLYVNCVDVHGNKWHGKNAGAGMCIKLRPMK